MSPCPSRRRDLADLVDGVLEPRAAERLTAHLVGCPGCQAEVTELRDIRERLRPAEAGPSASVALTDRLVSIAGGQATQPLYARPFDQQTPRALPSTRRRARRAVLGAVTLTCVLIAGMVGVGWVAAPATETPALDPGPLARDEFAAMLASTPLANSALTVARARGLATHKTAEIIQPGSWVGALSHVGAQERLEQAERALSHTSFTGRQVMQVRHLAGYWVTEADVRAVPERGTHVTFSPTGQTRQTVLLPSRTRVDTAVLTGYELLTADGPRVAGRASVVVEAHREGRLAARWWLDAESGVVLWQQTYDRFGAVTLSAGFLELTIGPLAPLRHLPPRLAPRSTTASLALTSTDTLRGQGWLCRRQVAGLPLTAVRRDRQDPMVHTGYGDGVMNLSIIQQKGALSGAPDGFVWDPEHEAYRSLGMTTMFSWQSGDSVFTVITDGPTELAEAAVADLPHTSPVLRTRTDRVLDGWRTLLGVAQ